jgi:DNA (cytosine-5)-methyltransferase 1
VAQRRRRVFVVGHLGDWQRAAQVLFERESVQRNPAPSREARQGAAASVGGGPDGGRIAGAVTRKWSKGSGGPAGDECYNMVAQVFKVRGGVEREDGSRGSTNIGKQAGKGYLGSEERAFTLAAAQDQFVAQPVAFHNRQDPDVSGDITHPLGAKDNGMAVAQPVAFYDYLGSQGGGVEVGISPTLKKKDGVAVTQFVAQPVATVMQVRRLTPVECERLQGFPDGYTNIPWRKKPEAPDGPRYKALGNSMAVPCMAWIGQRIAEVDRGD